MVAHAFNPRILEAEASRSEFEGNLIHKVNSKILSS